MTHNNNDGGHIPAWVVQEIGRLQLELIVAQARIRELEKQAVEHEKPLDDFAMTHAR